MELIYAILLYLQAICTCTYTQPEMDMIIMVKQPQIIQIQNDPVLTNQIEQEYGEQAKYVIINEISMG